MTRALVLGGGGPVGIGWESGLLKGLADEGVDLGAADAIYGTSAGAFVGAQLALELDLAETVSQIATTRAVMVPGAGEGEAMAERMQALIGAIVAAAMSTEPAAMSRRELGRLALEADVISEADFLEFFAVLKGREWPERFACTAVGATTGEFVVWQADSEVDVQLAVASSCAVPCIYPPVTVAGGRYIDGGMRTALNADVAAGHDRVVAISVTPLSVPPELSNPIFDDLMGRVSAELDTLRSSGSDVVVIEPSPELVELSANGMALMDVGKASAAYDAGVRHGAIEAPRVAELWS